MAILDNPPANFDDFGIRYLLKQSETSKILVIPQTRYEIVDIKPALTDKTNAWIHPSTQWIDVLGTPGRFTSGDILEQQIFNQCGSTVQFFILIKGHFERSTGDRLDA